MSKMSSDLKNGNVQIKEVKKTNTGQPLLNAASVGVNTNGIITSCLNFLDQSNVNNKLAIKVGRNFGLTGLALGTTQTIVAFTDGNVSNADILGAVSTALNAAGIVSALIPGAQPIAGVIGVASCIIGVISAVMPNNTSLMVEVTLKNNSKIYVYISGANTVIS